MKQVNFSHSGGFPLEQETLERLQTAYRSELYEALKRHFSIETQNNYIIAAATPNTKGWTIIYQYEVNSTGELKLEGILYPIQKGTATNYLKTTRIGTNLVYGNGISQTAYFDYSAEYISETEYNNTQEAPENDDTSTVYYYDLRNFIVVKDLQTIQESINLINESYLPLNGSKAMQGDLDLGTHQLSKLDIKESNTANVRTASFNFGSETKRGLKHSGNYLGRALVDNSTASTTCLNINYGADWENTNIGGKVYFDNLNNTNSNGSLLVLDNANQVIKSSTLIDSLLNRITALENKPVSTIPIGMVAIWGKPAPFPEGWEEYTPLKGRMPVGFDTNDSTFNTLLNYGGNKEKTLLIEELPPHDHDIAYNKKNAAGGGSERPLDNTGTSTDTQKTGSRGGGLPFSIMNPYRVIYFIQYTGKSSDTTKPTSPTNLTASNIGTTSLSLNWTAATDNEAVTNYQIFKNDISLAELGNILSYNAIGLSSGTSYSFHVIAKDAAGNSSIPSNSINVTTQAIDTTAPTVPAYLHSYTQGQGLIGLEWGTSTDVNPINYELWRSVDGFAFFLFETTSNTYSSDTGLANQTHAYKVRAVDSSGNKSDFSPESVITISSL
ncbi:fibronectin type III domain-containing protein [Flavobacterium sp.]|uniref:fibronectin type III domain-containing protein n=1 Tax=Flavobacterium sp. TaxID=239 RepID=UPI0031DF14D3